MCAAGNKKANWFLSAAGNSERATPSSRWADVCNVCSGGREGRLGSRTAWPAALEPHGGITTSPSPGTHGRKGWGSRCIPLPRCSHPPWAPLSVHICLICWVRPTPTRSAHGTASLTSGSGLLPAQNLRFLGQVTSTVFYSCPWQQEKACDSGLANHNLTFS